MNYCKPLTRDLCGEEMEGNILLQHTHIRTIVRAECKDCFLFRILTSVQYHQLMNKIPVRYEQCKKNIL